MRSRPGAASRGTPSASLKAEQKSLEASVRAKREAQGVLAGVKQHLVEKRGLSVEMDAQHITAQAAVRYACAPA